MNLPARVEVRIARTDDLQAIVAAEGNGQAHAWSARAWAEELEAGRLCLVADEGGAVVGALALNVAMPEAEILRVIVAANARRRGLGAGLLAEALRRAAALGCTQIHLEVAAGNAAARELYRRAGFSVVGRRPAYYRDPPDDAVLMRVEI